MHHFLESKISKVIADAQSDAADDSSLVSQLAEIAHLAQTNPRDAKSTITGLSQITGGAIDADIERLAPQIYREFIRRFPSHVSHWRRHNAHVGDDE